MMPNFCSNRILFGACLMGESISMSARSRVKGPRSMPFIQFAKLDYILVKYFLFEKYSLIGIALEIVIEILNHKENRFSCTLLVMFAFNYVVVQFAD